MKTFSLKKKIIGMGVLLTLLPLIIVSVIAYHQNIAMSSIAKTASTDLAMADLDHIADSVYALCQSQQELIQANVNSALNVAQDVMDQTGAVSFDDSAQVPWNAVNQYTKNASTVSLPKMMVGGTWLTQNNDSNVASPVVDKVSNLVGSTCTIFQRMNDDGDMLRISTNVKTLDGSRAIGTYIPRTNPDGQPNPVIEAVLRGETFSGRAYVVNQWYITAYKPILDKSKNVVGVLYVGIPQESVTALRKAIMATKVGQTGYVYVLDSQGRYVISKDGKRDGEDISQAKDANGNLFIQDICKQALPLQPEQTATLQYPWKNQGETDARMKIVRVKYFQPWDWVIGVGSYEDEFFQANNQINDVGQRNLYILGGVFLFSGIASILSWFMMSSRIIGRIMKIISQLRGSSQQVGSASVQVSSASQSLAQGANEQAANIEETSASIEEMASMTKQNAANAAEARSLASQAREHADNGTDSMQRMSQAIADIKKSSDETAKIIKTIDDIAFQTNLLALNAAVEAARAGEAGKGFAVVAEEVRSLAQRSAEAARTTADMIQQSVKNSDNGVTITKEVADVLESIAVGNRKVNDLVNEIAAASEEQSQGIEQVNTAVSQMEQVTQQNAANAEESASAAEELKSQAEELNLAIEELQKILLGTAYEAASSRSTPSFLAQQHRAGRPQPGRIKRPTGASAKRASHNTEEVFPLEDRKLSEF